MKVNIFLLCLSALFLLNCNNMGEKSQRQSVENNQTQSQSPGPNMITEEEAIAIARRDAVNGLGSLDDFEIVTSQQTTEWRIIFQLKNKALNGGGAIYLIDKATGRITNKKFYQ